MLYIKRNLIKKLDKYLLLCIISMVVASTTYSQQKDIDSLKTELKNKRNLVHFKAQDTIHINLLTKLAQKLTFYKPDSLLSLSNEALALSIETNYSKGQFDGYIGIGQYHLYKGEHDKAITQYNLAKNFSKRENNLTNLAIANMVLAEAYEFKQDFAEALNHYLTALELAAKTNNNRLLSHLNKDIGILYGRQKDFEQARHHFNISKKLNESINDEYFSAKTLINLGDLSLHTKEYDKAIEYINTGISIFEKHEKYEWLTYSYELKGIAYYRQKKYDWALFWYKQSLKLFEDKIKDEREEVHLLASLTSVNIALGNYDIAESYAIKGFEIAKRHNFKVSIKEHAKNLYLISKHNKNYEKALEYNELQDQITDSIQQNESAKSMVMLKIQMKHEQQKAALIAENEQAIAEQKNYIYITLAILLILAGIAILIIRNNGEQKKLTLELGEKKDVLETQKIELSKVNKTKDKLFSIIGHDLRGPIAALQGILQLFNNKEIKQNELTNLVPKLLGDIDHISFTLNNLLSWGQSQMNGSTTKFSKVHLINTVEENMNLLSEIANEKSIKMVNSLTGKCYALADSNQIDIVIRNLLSNALKFTPNNGQVTIASKDNGLLWELSVKDTGIGMDYDTLEHLFDSNENISTYGTNNEKGTGLGLSLCKEMVENNNGTIWVDSKLNEGSTFFFTIQKFVEIP